MRAPATRAVRAAPALLLVILVASACGGDGAAGNGPGADSARAGVAARAPGDSAGTPPQAAASDTLRPLRAFRVRLRNRGADTVVVAAGAGAGERTLDTVPPADSSEARVETRARRLEIRARGRAGREAARSLYDLERPPADSVLGFEVPAEADTAG